ncbi:MAG TPA: hypothetical protein PL110_12730 [Candidatus Eremiobacteraeota bacterium]|nr:hypothetical protein [Candidatus Eremiobacteraeota bacterium]
MFRIFFTDEAKEHYRKLKNDRGLLKRYKAVKKAVKYLASDPRHKSLNTHEFTGIRGPRGEKIFEAYAEQATPAAYRIFWCYGPKESQITIISITSHP